MIGHRKFVLSIVAMGILGFLCWSGRMDGVTAATAITTVVSFSFGALALERFGGIGRHVEDSRTQYETNHGEMERKNGKG